MGLTSVNYNSKLQKKQKTKTKNIIKPKMKIWLLRFIKDILLIEMPVDQVVTNANTDNA